MDHSMLERCVGRYCTLFYGRHGGTVKATILAVQGNWMEVQAKEEIFWVNADHLSQISPI